MRDSRDRLVAQVLDLRRRAEELAWSGEEGESLLELRQELATAHETYARSLPPRALSRCPHSGEALRVAIDDWGIDGPWWDAEWPIRPWTEAPRSLVVMAGALRLQGDLEEAPFLVKPGPQVPFLSPSMLERPEVRAVVSTLPVGRHVGYPVVYYADPQPNQLSTLNTWGAGRWQPPWDELAMELEIVEDEAELDRDLEAWIRRGKLLWIAPNDPDLKLRATVTGCPYLGLRGPLTPSRIMDGRLLEVEP